MEVVKWLEVAEGLEVAEEEPLEGLEAAEGAEPAVVEPKVEVEEGDEEARNQRKLDEADIGGTAAARKRTDATLGQKGSLETAGQYWCIGRATRRVR